MSYQIFCTKTSHNVIQINFYTKLLYEKLCDSFISNKKTQYFKKHQTFDGAHQTKYRHSLFRGVVQMTMDVLIFGQIKYDNKYTYPSIN